jgi:hypothetical protein
LNRKENEAKETLPLRGACLLRLSVRLRAEMLKTGELLSATKGW